MKKKYIAAALALCLCLTLFTACGQKSGSSHESKTESTTVNVGTWKTAQTLTPYLYADFLPKGINASIKPFTNPGDQKTALLAGSLDMTGTTIPTAITAAAAGEPIKIVVTLSNKCSALVVGKDSGIKSTKDLKGKKIAYVPGTMHHVLLLDVLEKAGLDPDKDVKLLRIDFFDMCQALEKGQIDAFLSGEPDPSMASKEGFGTILAYPYFDDSIGTINSAMIVQEKTIKENPKLVRSLVKAHVDATNYMNKHKDAWLNKAAEFGTDKDLLRASANNIELCWDIDDAYIKHTKALAKKMLELKMIDKMPDIDALFDRTFVNHVKGE